MEALPVQVWFKFLPDQLTSVWDNKSTGHLFAFHWPCHLQTRPLKIVEVNGAFNHDRYERTWFSRLCVVSNIKVFLHCTIDSQTARWKKKQHNSLLRSLYHSHGSESTDITLKEHTMACTLAAVLLNSSLSVSAMDGFHCKLLMVMLSSNIASAINKQHVHILNQPSFSYLQDFSTVIFLIQSTISNIWVASCNLTTKWLHKF